LSLVDNNDNKNYNEYVSNNNNYKVGGVVSSNAIYASAQPIKWTQMADVCTNECSKLCI